MNKPMICFSFLLLSLPSTYSQTTKTKKDFNKDGVIDQVTITEDGGSAFSSKVVQYFNGKTKKTYEFLISYSFGSFFTVCNIPNVVGKSGRGLLGNLLFGKKDSIDPSLNWLINACSNISSIGDPQLADFATKYTPLWLIGEPKIPEGYYAILNNARFKKLLKNVDGSPDFDFTKMRSDFFWIDYNPHNHRNKSIKINQPIDTTDFKVIKGDKDNWIYTTSHGVLIKNQNKYSWVFINDNKLFDANEKLRWPSIEDVQMIQDFILVRQSVNSGGINLFIINPVSGFLIRLNKDFVGLDSFDRSDIDKEKEVVELSDSNGKSYSLTLKAINNIFQKLF